MKKSGKSVNEVAKETGIDRKYLSELANNKIPADEILLAEAIVLSKALDLEIANLYSIEPLHISGIGEI